MGGTKLSAFLLDMDKDSLQENANNYEKLFIGLGQKAKEMPLPCSVLFLLLKILSHSLGGTVTLRVSQTCNKSSRTEKKISPS